MKNIMIKKLLFIVCLFVVVNRCVNNVYAEVDEDIYRNNREEEESTSEVSKRSMNDEELDTAEEDRKNLNDDDELENTEKSEDNTNEENEFFNKAEMITADEKINKGIYDAESNSDINEDKEENETDKKKKKKNILTFEKLFNTNKKRKGGCFGGVCPYNGRFNRKNKKPSCTSGACPFMNDIEEDGDSLLLLSALLDLLEGDVENVENNNVNMDGMLMSMLSDPLFSSILGNNNNPFFNSNNNPFSIPNNNNAFYNPNNNAFFNPFYNPNVNGFYNANNNPFYNPFMNNNNAFSSNVNPFMNNNNNPFMNNNNNPFMNNNNNPFMNNNNNPLFNSLFSSLFSPNNNNMNNNPEDLFSDLFDNFNDVFSGSSEPFRKQFSKNEVHVSHPKDNDCVFLIKWDQKILLDNVNVNVDTVKSLLIVKYNYTFIAGTSSQSSASVLKESISKKCDASENAVLSKSASYSLSNDNSGGSILKVWFPYKPESTKEEEDKEDKEEEYVENTTKSTDDDGYSEFTERRATTKFSNAVDLLKGASQKNKKNMPSKKADYESHIKPLEEDEYDS